MTQSVEKACVAFAPELSDAFAPCLDIVSKRSRPHPPPLPLPALEGVARSFSGDLRWLVEDWFSGRGSDGRPWWKNEPKRGIPFEKLWGMHLKRCRCGHVSSAQNPHDDLYLNGFLKIASAKGNPAS